MDWVGVLVWGFQANILHGTKNEDNTELNLKGWIVIGVQIPNPHYSRDLLGLECDRMFFAVIERDQKNVDVFQSFIFL